MSGQEFDNVREVLAPLIGRVLIEVTQDDWEDVCRDHPDPEERESRIYLHFDDGTTLAFNATRDAGFCYPLDGVQEEEN